MIRFIFKAIAYVIVSVLMSICLLIVLAMLAFLAFGWWDQLHYVHL
jgi:hypothetical protein